MNTFLETGIALCLIIFSFSIISYVVQEIIAVNLKFRGNTLKASISKILGGAAGNLDQKVFQHPQIKMLHKELKTFPGYIPASNFAMAVMDLGGQYAATPSGDLLKDFKDGIAQLKTTNPDVYQLFKNWADNSTNGKELKNNIEKWFNDYMDRVTGWYKKNYNWITRCIAIVLAISFNVDMVRISKTVYSDSVLRSSLVATAGKLVEQSDSVTAFFKDGMDQKVTGIKAHYDSILSKIDSGSLVVRDSVKNEMNQKIYAEVEAFNAQKVQMARIVFGSIDDKTLIGWPGFVLKLDDLLSGKMGFLDWLFMLMGLAIGAGLISMGAPFWFDMMVKLVNVRMAGVKPKTEQS
jgi:hypothetical protein